MEGNVFTEFSGRGVDVTAKPLRTLSLGVQYLKMDKLHIALSNIFTKSERRKPETG